MSILEGILYLIWRGLAIGIIISAPMGPVGILCIQRTLEKGRMAGFYTGVGAALSDLVYCLLTGFGLSFVEEFLEKNSDIIQLLGSVVLIAFGVYLFKSNPSQNLRKPSESEVSPGRNILNGFLFTFSNPLIIFLIIGLFARFNFSLPDFEIYQYFVGFLFIIGGALLWWLLVTWFVAKVRAHFNLRSMWLVNKIIGSVILIFAVVGIITSTAGLMKMKGASTPPPALREVHMNSARGFSQFKSARDTALIIHGKARGLTTDMIPVLAGADFEWSFRAAVLSHSRPAGFSPSRIFSRKKGRNLAPWGMVLKGDGQTCRIMFQTVDEDSKPEFGGNRDAGAHIAVSVKNGDHIFYTGTLKDGVDIYSGWNAVQLDCRGRRIGLRIGNREYTQLFDGIDIGFTPTQIGYFVGTGGALKIDWLSVTYPGLQQGDITPALTVDEVVSRLKHTRSKVEGMWMIYDRQLDDRTLRPGGDYKLAVVRDGDRYLVVYLDGASRRADRWEPGMVKGVLRPTPFKNVFNLEWLDAGGRKLKGDAKAELDDDLLRIYLPAYNSDFRLRRIQISKI